jgi:pimeloyl-ACP methyl ester carboxylesterase
MISKVGVPTKSFYTKLHRFELAKKTPFPMVNPFDYHVKSEEYEGFQLQTYEYPTKTNAKALMFFLNGFGDSALNYGYFFKAFADQGIRVYSFDRRGFGYS